MQGNVNVRSNDWNCRKKQLREKLEVIHINEKVKETRFKWYEHIQRGQVDALVKRYNTK